MELVIVERRLDEPRELAQLHCLEHAAAACLSLYRVRALHAYVSRDRRRLICVYEAPDAESVRQANRKAGLPFETAWSADVLEPHGAAAGGAAEGT